jgi:hypothetical protein
MVLIYDENNNLYKIIYDEKQIKTMIFIIFITF